MRTIKFRGKRHYDGEWVYGYPLIVDTNKYKATNIVTLHEAYPDTLAKVTTSVEFNTLGQFTGLTDKNGKEIYEGDIVRSTRNGFGGVVMWHKRGYFYICENIFEDVPDHNDDYAKLGSMLENHPYFEVVGNISDNTPERLKGGE